MAERPLHKPEITGMADMPFLTPDASTNMPSTPRPGSRRRRHFPELGRKKKKAEEPATGPGEPLAAAESEPEAEPAEPAAAVAVMEREEAAPEQPDPGQVPVIIPAGATLPAAVEAEIAASAPPPSARRRNGAAVRRRKPRKPLFEFPWELPYDLKVKGELTVEELEAEARQEQPILKRMGFRNSAIFSPALMKRQYLRAAGFLGWLGIKPYIGSSSMVVLGILAMAGFFWMALKATYGLDSGGVEASADHEIPAYWGAIVGSMVGTIIFFPAAGLLLAFSRFDTAYAQSTVVQAYYDHGNRFVMALARVPLLRMATATSQDDRYIGPDGHNSFGKGRSLLEVEDRLTKISDVRAFYDAKPRHSTWSGMFATSTNSWYSLALDGGRLKRERNLKLKEKKWKLDPVGNGGILICLIALVFALIVGVTGFDAAGWASENMPYGEP